MVRLTCLILYACIIGIPSARAASAGMSLPVAVRPGSTREAACRNFVQHFYTWYTRAARDREGFEVAIDKRPSNFSAVLLRALRRDRSAQSKSPHEIVGLEFDPFLNSQDSADRYDVGKVTRTGDRYMAEIYGHYKGQHTTRPSLVAELRMEHGRWVFANFHYAREGSPPRTDDLLAILASLRAERAKGR